MAALVTTPGEVVLSEFSETQPIIGIVASVNLLLLELDSESDDDDLVKQLVIGKYQNRFRRRKAASLTISTRPPRFNSSEFKSSFGMTRTSFEKLCIDLSPHLMQKPEGMSNEKHFMIGLWLFANGESFRSVCDRFRVGRSTAWSALKWTMDALHRLDERNGIIAWPRGRRANDIVEHFRRKHGFPDVLGCLGARRVLLLLPQHADVTGSLVLQAVCDERSIFVDVHVTRVDASARKSSVLHRSPLGARLRRDADFPRDGHLLADGSYNLQRHLLTPYGSQQLTPAQRGYDAAHALCRSTVDRAFARLLARFRGLALVDVSQRHLAADFVSACCVLHNLCILNGDPLSKKEAAAEAAVEVSTERPVKESLAGLTRCLETVKRDSVANLMFVFDNRQPS